VDKPFVLDGQARDQGLTERDRDVQCLRRPGFYWNLDPSQGPLPDSKDAVGGAVMDETLMIIDVTRTRIGVTSFKKTF
jgi:hypothetical protein